MLCSRDISRLRADVAANCNVFLRLCKAAGLNVLVTQTVRDDEYQAQLYAQGRTKPGSIVTNQRYPTFHWSEAGLAFDICKNVKGHEYDDLAFFNRCGEIGKKIGFSWGGDWLSLQDKPHFQWDEHGKYTGSMIRAGKRPATMPLYQNQVKKEAAKVTKDEAKSIIKTKAGLSDSTIAFLDAYRYGDDLLIKLATAMQ